LHPDRPPGQGAGGVAPGAGRRAAGRTAGTPGGLTMGFRETAAQARLREAGAKTAADFGHDYFLAKAKAGEKTTELWQAVSRAGFVGVNLPEEDGGGGRGVRGRGVGGG